ncbi:serine hydrolase domain-containing protein [Actinomyces sp. ZJ308]|uniref:serine hydrolase domain-containing protein n=1 Tax=Actinomyces sp. ZJ308 TaxID=2708342 RepID=UPI0014214AB3|nr:serine hydrolase domain-containing protein [Actinomyces sp. ZJ308]
MSTSTSPVPRSDPPLPQVRPASPSRPSGLLPRWACAVLAACLALVVFAAGPHTPKADTSAITGDKDLAKQVIGLLPDDYQAQGIHVSVITADSVRHTGIGTAASGQQYTSTTPMEIGSITKTFTGQLLADAIARGEVKASDPLSTHLPELAGTPAGEATLEEVASHRSGIPSIPTQDESMWMLQGNILGLNPFTDSIDRLIDKARTTEMSARGEFAYSNLGISLLGEALTRAAGAESWKSYITERLFTPLGMEHTTLTAGQSDIPDGAIHGVQANGRRGQSLSGSGTNPAGAGVWSTPEDMTRYAQAVLADTVPGGTSPQEPRWPAEVMAGIKLPGEKVGYTWYTDVVDGHTIINHGGTTMEYMTHLAIDKGSGKAVMVYTDQNTDGTASALAAALLTDGQKASTARMPISAEMLPQGMLLGAFSILALVMGLYTAARAASAPSRMAVACRAASIIACLMAAAASGPWVYLPTWILGVAALPGMYGIVRGITLWPELPTLPRRRAWLGWMQVGLTLAFVAACLAVAWPKA